MRTAVFLLPALVIASLGPAAAQEKKEPAVVYKVEFRIRDGSDAAAKTPRRYTMLIDSTGKGTFRVGERVPVATGSFQPGTGANTMVNTQFTYIDIGVTIDTSVREQDGKVALSSSLDISSLVQHKQQAGATILSQPTTAQTRITVNALVPAGKPTMVASIDDPVTEHKFEVEALVTKVD